MARRARGAPADAKLLGKRDELRRRAGAAGLLGLHSGQEDQFEGEPSAAELARLRQLQTTVDQLTQESVAPERMLSALSHYELWRQELPSRVPFLPLWGEGSPGRVEAAQYNERSLGLFATSCLERGSLQRGRRGAPIQPNTVTGYVSALRSLLTRDGGVKVFVPEANVVVPAVASTVRLARPPAAPRRRRRGLRASHLRAALERGVARRGSFSARREWLAAVLGHRLVMRGAELGRRDERTFSSARGLTWRNIEWREAGAAHETQPVAVVHLCDAKDQGGNKQRYPLLVRAMGDAPRSTSRVRGSAKKRRRSTQPSAEARAESDGLCAYWLLREAWEEDVATLGRAAALDAPVFRTSAGGGAAAAGTPLCARLRRDPRKEVVRTRTYTCAAPRRGPTDAPRGPPDAIPPAAAYTTGDVGRVARRVALAAGEEPSDFGAHSLRIGGASDYRDLAGPEHGRRLLNVFGRWRRDISYLYARQSIEEAMEASASVAGVNTRDLESMFTSFTQG